jgi:hypothetical protein
MSRRMYSRLLIGAASAAVVAGCGGANSSSTTTTTTTATTAGSATTTRTHTSSTATAAIPPQGSAGAVVAAFCESALSLAKTHLTSVQIGEFKAYCTALSHENASQIKASENALCTQILKDSLPASERSLATTECAQLRVQSGVGATAP